MGVVRGCCVGEFIVRRGGGGCSCILWPVCCENIGYVCGVVCFKCVLCVVVASWHFVMFLFS